MSTERVLFVARDLVERSAPGGLPEGRPVLGAVCAEADRERSTDSLCDVDAGLRVHGEEPVVKGVISVVEPLVVRADAVGAPCAEWWRVAAQEVVRGLRLVGAGVAGVAGGEQEARVEGAAAKSAQAAAWTGASMSHAIAAAARKGRLCSTRTPANK